MTIITKYRLGNIVVWVTDEGQGWVVLETPYERIWEGPWLEVAGVGCVVVKRYLKWRV
jgi:hypothetical protein